MCYQHLTIEKRYHIQAYKKAGYKQYEIAKELGVDPATISRELKRNSSTQRKSYSAKSAAKVANDRRMYASRESNKKMDKKLQKIVIKYIQNDWSPEQISQRLKAIDIAEISHVRIYQFVKENKLNGGDLYTHLRFCRFH